MTRARRSSRALIGDSPRSLRLASKTATGPKLLNAYQHRFWRLKALADGDANAPSSVGPAAELLLTRALRDAMQWLRHCGVIVAGSANEDVLCFGTDRFLAGSTIESLTMQFAEFEDFYVDLCHGDLHLDNVILVRQHAEHADLSSWTNFYIDFAEAGKHHAMLDFVVMDIALRFQRSSSCPASPTTLFTRG